MVYKKYIKRGGKVYGPYTYHSRKENGKVITEYLGKAKPDKKNSTTFIIGGILLLISLAIFLNLPLTGKITLLTRDNYQPEEQITGSLKLNLKQGELVPISTKIIINNAGEENEFLLSELVSYNILEGNFYVENKEISGTGKGYGFIGEKIIYPVINFDLNILGPKKDKAKKQEVEEEIEEELEEEQEEIEEAKEEIEEELEEEQEEIEEAKEEIEEELEEEEIEEEPEEQESSLITGEVISELKTISGSVSEQNKFEHDLEKDQTAKIVKSSVIIGEEIMSEDIINLELKKNKVIVSTDYHEIKRGFGEEYLSDEIFEMHIDLEKFNLTAQEGELIISLIYDNVELVSVSETISVEENITETIEQNITIETIINITAENVSILTIQYDAVLNKPVKWKKNIKLDKKGVARIEIPKQAENITVYKIIEEINESIKEITEEEFEEEIIINKTTEEIEDSLIDNKNITKQIKSKKRIKITAKIISGEITAEIKLDKKSSIINFFKRIFSFITGRVIDIEEKENVKEVVIDENATEFEIEYETPGPVAFESPLGDDSNGPQTSYGKEIVISSDVHYENILAYTELPKEVSESAVRLYWIVNETKKLVNITKYDLNNNSLVDYIEWVVPSLSSPRDDLEGPNQTYELIIEITKAEHLDENRVFISDIYEEVRALDSDWSEVINNGEYVRVTFEQPLDNTRDITIYARAVEGISSIEVYEKDSDETVAVFNEISDEGWYKVYLTGLGECYDDETEIFTGDGWKLFKDLDKTEEVATLNQKTGELEWQSPTDYPTFDYDKEMFKIVLEDESDLLVSEKHRVYSSSKNLFSSLVLNAGISDCSLKCLSLDQTGMLSSIANARNGTSFLSEINCDAFDLDSSEGDMNLIILGRSDDLFSNSSLVISDLEQMVLEYFSSSFSNVLGENNSTGYEFISSAVYDSALNNDRTTLVSITNFIYNFLFSDDLSMSSFNFLPNSRQSLSVNLEFFNPSLNFSNASSCFILLANASLAIEDQLSHSNLSILCLNSLGTDKVNDGIFTSYTYDTCDMYDNTYQVFKSFDLQPITDVYERFNSGEREVYFLDSKNQPVKVLSIEKEKYNGKIYDVDIENDIVLVRRNGKAVWSGNSDSQDVFDLRIIGSIEFDYIVDPITYFLDDTDTNWNLGTLANMEAEGTGTDSNLTSSASSGGFLSRIFNAGSLVDWKNLTYSLEYPYGEELPNNQQDVAWGNMTGNVLLMHFNNDSDYSENDTHIYDFSGNENNGTAYNGTAWTSSGKYGGAFEFDGVDDYVKIQNDTGGNLNVWAASEVTSGTISAWVNFAGLISGTSNRHDMIDIEGRIMLSYDDGERASDHVIALINDGDVIYSEDTITPNVNQWYYFVMTWDGSNINLYRDGQSIDSDAQGSPAIDVFSREAAIGSTFGGTTHYFNGSIDEVAIFNRSLSAEEIKEHYHRGAVRLNLSVRSCDDSVCSGETWNETTNNATFGRFEDLTDSDNQYFQYMFNYTNTSAASVRINNITIRYEDVFASDIEFVAPTPTNDTTQSETNVEINISITEANLDEVKFNWNQTNYTIFNDSLILMMNFDNVSALGENDTLVKDMSGYGNNGTGEGGVTWNSSGKYGGVFEFDGINDYVKMTSTTSLRPTVEVSMSTWVKLSATGSRQYIIANEDETTDPQNGYSIRINSDDVIMMRIGTSSATNSISGSTTLFTGIWYYVVGTYNGSEGVVYLNGVKDGNLTFSGIIDEDTTEIDIGRRPRSGDGLYDYFNGSIDEVRIYNRSLSADEIQQQYFTNLNKYDTDKWALYINQSKNSTDGLDDGSYTYFASAKDDSGNENLTEIRSVTIQEDMVYPQINFTSPTPANATAQSETSVEINVSITESNLNEVKWNWNGTNFTIFNDSLVLMMNFNNVSALGESYNNSNGSVIVDVSNSGNNGTLYVGADGSGNYTDGKYGGAFEFDGVNDYVDCGKSQDYNFTTGNFSFTTWIYLKDGSDNRIFNFAESGGCGTEVNTVSSTRKPRIVISDDGYTNYIDVSGTTSIGLNEWHHIAFVRDSGNTSKIYLDGGDITPATYDHTSTVAIDISCYDNLEIGTSRNHDGNFNGSIDEIRIYNHSLSAEEVQQLYFTNLNKYDSDKWTLYINQSKNSTDGLDDGSYTYFASAKDTTGNENLTEIRSLTVSTADTTAPTITWESPTPTDQDTITYDSVYLNTTITDASNTSAWFDWNKSLVGYWAMDFYNSSGVYDNSTYDNFGTFNGGLGTDNITTGKYGDGLEFDGVNDYVDMGEDSSLNIIDEITLGAWIKFSTLSENGNIISKHENTFTAAGYRIVFTTDGKMHMKIYDGASTGPDGVTALNDNNWHHIAGTWNGSIITLYVDGNVDGTPVSYSGTPGNDDINVNIGAEDSGFEFFNGTIDEVKIYNRALSPEEINASYNNGLYRLYHNFTDLDNGLYNYSTYAIDALGNLNITNERSITISVDTTPLSINFTFPTPANATTQSETSVEINISITESDLDEVKFNWNQTNYTIFNDSLVLMMNFDNVSALGENDNYAVDVSGNGNNGTIIGAIFNSTGGKYNGAFEFDGVNDYVNVNSTTGLNKDTGTIGVWFKTGSVSTGYNYFVSHYSVADTRIYFGINDDKLWYRIGNLTDTFADTTILLNTWYYTTLTWDNGNVQVYLNGDTDDTQQSGTLADIASYLVIGASRVYDNFFNGSIDEVRIYNRSLSADEVYQQYVSNLNKYDTDKWALYVNQSLNSTDGLDDGSYTYFASAKDSLGNENLTEERTITVDATPPSITLNKPENNTYYGQSFVNWTLLNATIIDNYQDSTVYFYANNDSNGLNNSEGLVYIAENVVSGSEVTYNLTALPIKPSEDGLVLLMHFDNRSEFGEDDSLVYDFSENGNNGTCTNCPAFNLTGGKFAGAFEFDGVNDYVELPNLGLKTTSVMTLSAWVKSSASANQRIISFNNGNNPQVFIRINGDSKALVFARGTDVESTSKSSTATVNDSNWHHIVGIINEVAGQVELYLDGSSEGTATYGSSFTDVALSERNEVGRASDTVEGGPIQLFNGTIDEVAIYNRSLSAEEILNHYRLGEGKYYWNVNATDGSLSSVSDVLEFSVDRTKPAISFVAPTDANNSYVARNWSYVNVSTSDTNNITAFIDWNNSLVGWWRFNDEAGENTTFFRDWSSYANNGTCTNCPAKTTAGRFGSALEFDGVDDYVNVSDSDSLNPSKFTITGWIYLKQTPVAYTRILYKAVNDYGYQIRFEATGKLQTKIRISNSTSHNLDGTSVLPVNQWTFFSWTYDNSTSSVYINGGFENSINATGQPDGDGYDLYLGGRVIYNDLYFNGSIDEVKIFNRALSPEEINASYNAGLYRLYNNFTDLTEGTYTYKTYSQDQAGNTNETELRTLSVDITFSQINITYPQNTSYAINVSALNYTYTETNCDSAWWNNETDNSTRQNCGLNWTGLISNEGSNTWTIYMNDSAGNENSTSITFLKDLTKPTINLMTPQNNSGDSDGNITFNYNVTDANNIANCSLIINSQTNQTNTSITKDTTQNFTLNNLIAASYNWSINCADEINNVNNSETRIITVVKTTTFTGDTTDLTLINISNITNLVIEETNNGKINFSESVDLSQGADLDTHVNISFNRIEINSTALTQLNKSAKLFLYNLTFSDPRILRDGSECSSSICTRESYSGGTLTFNVTKFTVYSTDETPTETPPTVTAGGGSGATTTTTIIPTPEIKFTLSPELYEKTIALNRIEFGEFTITNNENLEKNFNIKVETLENTISFEEISITLSPGETKKLEFRIHAPRNIGIYTGKIIVSSGSTKKEILIIINVKTEKSLFDITLTIPKFMKIMNLGTNLNAQIDLLQMGLKEKIDVTLNYVIKDFSGKVYLTESETLAVYDQKSIKKEFYTEELAPKDYVIGVEVIYPGGVAIASSQFKIKEKFEIKTEQIILVSLTLIVIFALALIGFTIRRYKKIGKHLKK